MVLAHDLAEAAEGAALLRLAVQIPHGILVVVRADVPDDLLCLLVDDEAGLGLAVGNDDVVRMGPGVLHRIFIIPVVRAELGHGVAVDPVSGLDARGTGHLPGRVLEHGGLELVVKGHFVKMIAEAVIPDDLVVLVHFKDVIVVQRRTRGERVAVVFGRGEQMGKHQNVLIRLEKHFLRGAVVAGGAAVHLVVVVHARERNIAHDLAVKIADGKVGGMRVAVSTAFHFRLLAGSAHDVTALEDLGGMLQFADVLPFLDHIAVHVDEHTALSGRFHAEHGEAAPALFRFVNGGAVGKHGREGAAHAGHHGDACGRGHTHKKMTSIHSTPSCHEVCDPPGGGSQVFIC